MRVRLDCDAYYGSERLVKAFSGCEEMQIEVFEASFGVCNYHVLKAFEGIRGVKRACVSGSVATEYARFLECCMESELGVDCNRARQKEDNLPGSEDVMQVYDIWINGNR